MDCEKLSPNAQKIFEKIKNLYPPDPWQNPQWKEEGLVYDNGWQDLRKSAIRRSLIDSYNHIIGLSITQTAHSFRKANKEMRSCDINLKIYEAWIDKVIVLEELDFQIETMDLVE